MPTIRVFSSDNIELAPCNEDRANSLVRKGKACFVIINEQQVIVINKSSEQLKAKEDDRK